MDFWDETHQSGNVGDMQGMTKRFIVVNIEERAAHVCANMYEALGLVFNRLMEEAKKLGLDAVAEAHDLDDLYSLALTAGIEDKISWLDGEAVGEVNCGDTYVQLHVCPEGKKGVYRAFVTSDRANYVAPWNGDEEKIVASDDPTFWHTVRHEVGDVLSLSIAQKE